MTMQELSSLTDPIRLVNHGSIDTDLNIEGEITPNDTKDDVRRVGSIVSLHGNNDDLVRFCIHFDTFLASASSGPLDAVEAGPRAGTAPSVRHTEVAA